LLIDFLTIQYLAEVLPVAVTSSQVLPIRKNGKGTINPLPDALIDFSNGVGTYTLHAKNGAIECYLALIA
jgi:hypothetical protein